MHVSFFFRKPRENAYSIEHIFEGLCAHFKQTGIIGIRKIQVSTVRNLLTNIIQARAARSEVNHITGDIYYISMGLNRHNTVLTIHDCVFTTKFSKYHPKYWLINLFWYQIPIRRSKTVTVISEKTKQELIELTGVSEDKIKIIPNFYDPLLIFKPKVFNKTCPRILQIGTKANKNLPRIIEALKGIACELDIIGKLDDEILQLLKQSNIKYHNSSNIGFEEVKQKYELADMVLFVSTYEGFGMPIIEANAVGRPIITSKLSPMSEIAADSAIKVNPYDVLDIKLAIMQLIADDELQQKLILNGLKNAERYNIETVSGKYLNLYKSLHH
ncbi:MAG TPA: glycosyltransferase family 1 protein [Chitinophagaceae bacterium]|nr:glycosyltransferase family 1 protein [Chitinophagaceae bacterium]